MKLINKLKRRDNSDVLAFLCSFILIAIAFSLGQRMFFSRYSIMEGDFYGIYFQYYKLFINKLLDGDLFDHGKMFYSAIPGMGMDISAYVACEACLSPFNIFYVFISDNNLASILMVLFKTSTAAFFFQRLLRKIFDFSGVYSVMFAVSYSMCGYFAAYYFNTQFLEGLYLLPLIIYLVYEYAVKKNGAIKLCLAYAYLFIMCFYEAYIIGFFSFLLFILLTIFKCDDASRIKIRIWLKYVGLVAWAFILSAFIILPTAVYVLTNQASDATVDFVYNKNVFDFLSQLFLGMSQDYDGQFPCIYSGIFSILFVPLFFFNRRIDKKDKLIWGSLLGVLVISCFIKPLYLFWHCFDAPDSFGYRFAYIISFVLIVMAAKAFSIKQDEDNKILLVSAIIEGLLAILSFIIVVLVGIGIKREINIIYLIMDIVFIVVYILFIMNAKRINKEKIVSLCVGFIISVELCINTYSILAGANYIDLRKNDVLNLVESQLDSAISDIKTDNSVYRIYMKNSPVINYAMSKDAMSLEVFGSFENSKYRETMNRLGLETATRVTSDSGVNDITRMLFAQKYNIYSYGVGADSKLAESYYEENPYALNIGYMVSSNIDNMNIDDIDVFSNQNDLVNAMTGREYNCLNNVVSNVSILVDNVSGENSEEGGVNLYHIDNQMNAKASFIIDYHDDNLMAYIPRSDSVIYAGSPYINSALENDERLQLRKFYSAPSIIDLQRNADGKYVLNVAFDRGNLFTNIYVENILLYHLDYNKLKDVYSELIQNMLNINCFDDGYIEGEVEATKDKDTLFLSVPYDKHWKLLVDGKEQVIYPVLNNTFIGCKLTEGVHSIVLEYKNIYVYIGGLISVIGLLGIIMAVILKQSRNKNDVNKK